VEMEPTVHPPFLASQPVKLLLPLVVHLLRAASVQSKVRRRVPTLLGVFTRTTKAMASVARLVKLELSILLPLLGPDSAQTV